MSTDALSPLQTLGLIGGVTLAALSAKYHDRAIFDEHREGIPYRKGYPLVGALPIILANRSNSHDFFTWNFENLDSLTTTMSSIGIGRRISTIDPANIEHILKNNFQNYAKGPKFQEAFMELFGHGIFNANGERWKYQRKAASVIFNVMNFRDHFTDVFVQELRYMTKNIFDVAADNRQPVDFHDVMFKFTLDSFVLLGFGVELNGLQKKEKVPFAESFDAIQFNSSWRMVFPAWKLSETIGPLLTPWKMHVKDHIKVVDTFAYEVIAKRKKEVSEGKEFKDLLSRFMATRDENGDLLDDKTLRDVILNFIVAGRDTTAVALSWTFYYLMLHPRVEAKLLKEIEKNITDEIEENSPALYEVIKGMPYAHAVFYEILRLQPSVPGNVKYALNDDVLPDGTHIRAGDYVAWSPYAQGRSAKVWGPNAREFVPERWLTPEGDVRRESQGKWPAFHAGPRVCLGQQLATLESLVAIVMLLRRYKFSLLPDQEITYVTTVTMPMKNGMNVLVEKRY
ncbi:cytochrome P450 [Fennellomyces sp. T-0311]|nr:cytochrome P450 [Fennellomyces sp. T-0311]